LLEQKGQKGKKAVLSKYNWKSDGNRLIEGYRRIERTGDQTF
jgi:hypothetical protein